MTHSAPDGGAAGNRLRVSYLYMVTTSYMINPLGLKHNHFAFNAFESFSCSSFSMSDEVEIGTKLEKDLRYYKNNSKFENSKVLATL